ncbi:MAG: hypothetical protein EOP33_06510 [Rickettsiaceae bacterium]|nr:MAG: hypothetical protein EOP33_06510 [Rickettsiaceae bacterium]
MILSLKKLKIVFTILLIILVLGYQVEKNLAESKEIALKADSLRSRYWGIEYFFEFGSFFSQKIQYQKLDLNSFEFEKFLQSQYIMFRLKKTIAFNNISNICFNILNYQLETKDLNFLKQLAEHAAMAVIKTLNNNTIGINEINAEKVNSEFSKNYGATLITPLNIFQILVDNNILILNKSIYAYKNPGTYYYYKHFSQDLMSMVIKRPNDYVCFMETKRVNMILSDFEKPDNISEFFFFKGKPEYKVFENLLLDWHTPEQYHDFYDIELKEKYLEIMVSKIKLNDQLFHTLLINSIGLGNYYYNPEIKLENCFYNLVEKTLINDNKKQNNTPK